MGGRASLFEQSEFDASSPNHITGRSCLAFSEIFRKVVAHIYEAENWSRSNMLFLPEFFANQDTKRNVSSLQTV